MIFDWLQVRVETINQHVNVKKETDVIYEYLISYCIRNVMDEKLASK